MEMKKINSGKLRAIGYDASHRMLQVQLDDGSTLQYSGVGEDAWRRLSNSGAAWSFYRDNIEEEFTAKRVSGNGHGCVSTPHARCPLLGPSLCSPLPVSAPLSNSLPQAGERTNEESNFKSLGEEANESLRELYIDAPAAKNPLDDLFGKP
ncbi:MAG: KTSC domain-containing protein [Gallionella sp.]|nr:KTSC domain-containing protein [Gallionella sp.]